MKKSEIMKIWRRRLKEGLEDLSSLEFQKEVWVERKHPNIWWEWNEAIDDYFNVLDEKSDNGSTDYYIKEKFLTQKEGFILKTFDKILRNFAEKTETPESIKEYIKLLDDPEWIAITEMAKKILKIIDFDTLPGKK